MSILAIGTVAFDQIETPFAKAAKVLGGSATYITLAARFFSDDVRLVAVVGADFPQSILTCSMIGALILMVKRLTKRAKPSSGRDVIIWI